VVRIFSRDIQLGHIVPIRSLNGNTSYRKIVSSGIALSKLRTNFEISIIFSSNVVLPLQIEISYNFLSKCSQFTYASLYCIKFIQHKHAMLFFILIYSFVNIFTYSNFILYTSYVKFFYIILVNALNFAIVYKMRSKEIADVLLKFKIKSMSHCGM